MAARNAPHFNERQHGCRQMADDPDRRKPCSGSKSPREEEVVGAHQKVADAGKGKDAGAGEVIDAVNKSEDNSGDAEYRHDGAADDETRGRRTVTALGIDARRPRPHVRVPPNPAGAVRFESPQTLNLITPHAPRRV